MESSVEVLAAMRVSSKMRPKVQRVLMVLLLGELFGLHTLHQVLHQQGIGSNQLQKVWQQLSCAQVVGWMNALLWQAFEREFEVLCAKSASTQSRARLTLVIDSSVFRQWLAAGDKDKFFGKYFSGQTHSTVWGFSLVLGGMTVGGVFYPLHFQVRGKGDKETGLAKKMLVRLHGRLQALALPALPSLYVSVDSGFTTPEVMHTCAHLGMTFIGVPRSNQVVYYQGQRCKIAALKQQYEAKVAGGEKDQSWRIRVQHQASGQEVVLLLFRLLGSDKVSLILTPDLDCKGKTLRRHWFERTRIEHFFRTLKHDLKIRQSTGSGYVDFVRKIALFLFKALFVTRLTRHCQKHLKQPRHRGFAKIRDLIIYHQMEQHLLQYYVRPRPFAENYLKKH